MTKQLLLILLFTFCASVWSKDCVQIDQCKCAFDDGSGTVDLSSIGRQDGTPLIQDQFAADNFAYSYNPCYGFTEGTCANAAACQFDSANVLYYNIGDSARVAFSYDGLNVIGTYTADDSQRTSTVTFVCDPNADPPNVEVKGEQATSTYAFTVTSKVACPTGGSGPSVIVTVTTSISAGTILVIVFFAVLVTYFIVGTVFMKFGKHRAGREVVPNVVFWAALPGLVKEGFGFVIGKTCRRSGYTKY